MKWAENARPKMERIVLTKTVVTGINGGKLTHDIRAAITDAAEEAIVNAVIQEAIADGVAELYLLDKKFVLDALREKIERGKEKEGLTMSDSVVLKTIEGRIRDLINPELEHDYEKEITEILEMIESEKVEIEEWWKDWNETIEARNKRSQAILDCVADAIILKEEKQWKL